MIKAVLIILSYSLAACVGWVLCALLTTGKITDLEKEAWLSRIEKKSTGKGEEN